MDASEVLFPPLDSRQQLSEYAATYYSDEFDADYKISLKGNKDLCLIRQPMDEMLKELLLSDGRIIGSPKKPVLLKNARCLFLTAINC